MDKQITDLLQQLAQKLGTTTEYLWGVMVRQAFIDGVTDIVYYVIVAAYLWIASKNIPKIWKRAIEIEEEDSWDDKAMLLKSLSIAIGAAGAIFTFISILNLSYTITKFVNPEYWALSQILIMLKGS